MTFPSERGASILPSPGIFRGGLEAAARDALKPGKNYSRFVLQLFSKPHACVILVHINRPGHDAIPLTGLGRGRP